MGVAGILGRKVGMTSYFLPDGTCIPVTVIQAGPCTVVQIRTKERDGYEAVQLGFEDVPERKVNKPMRGHFERAGVKPKRILKEVPVISLEDVQVGQEVRVDIFKEGEKVVVTGKSKGRGFAGVMKRWDFSGGPDSHGTTKVHRRPMSSGPMGPQRVFKGKKMPGHYGNETVTIRGVEVVKVDPERNMLVVKGSVPGPRGGLLVIRKEKREIERLREEAAKKKGEQG